MKTMRNILVAFLLNAFFSVFELIGGILQEVLPLSLMLCTTWAML